MIRRPPRSTHAWSSAASDVYKRQVVAGERLGDDAAGAVARSVVDHDDLDLSLIHISEPTRLALISYAVFCLKKKKKKKKTKL